ncbi:MAG: glycosyltransferase family 4 protein [Candidatus Moraniibacteriota bacterium]
MRILFISRAYPPVQGGIENQNYELSVWLPKYAAMRTIANRKGKKFLPFFLPYALLCALWNMRTYDVLLLGDGVLGIVGWCVKRCYPEKTVVSILHGLDLTFKSALYQSFWVKRYLPSLDMLIAVSEATRAAAIAKNIPEGKIIIIRNGVETEAFQGTYERTALEKLLGENLDGTYVLLTTGRLAKRKGAVWFIREVLPKLPASVIYVLAGTGPEEANIKAAIRETRTDTQVRMLGRVTDAVRNMLLNTADIFIQPNIRVQGDMEGFGIAVIEATACKRPVIASDLEGLKDAICHNESGILVEPENPEAFATAVRSLLGNESERRALGERAFRYTETHYHWNIIARLYIETLDRLIKQTK